MHRTSSSASTGGAGTFFEQHVDAFWLVQLLTGAIPPIFLDCTVEQVSFQNKRLGWQTDDFLVTAVNSAGTARRLAGQVKRTFTVSAADEECVKAITDFWNDFSNQSLFVPQNDRLVLITLRGTAVLLEHFAGLLDCARASRTADEFESRMATPGLVSKTASGYCNEILTIIAGIHHPIKHRRELWPFLSSLHLVSLDLNSSTSQTEAAAKTLLAYTAKTANPGAVAESSWTKLLELAGKGMPEARAIRREDLPSALLDAHGAVASTEHQTLQALSEHSTPILDGIRSTIGATLHLGREQLVQQVLDQLQSSQVVLIAGPAGMGKSGVAKDAMKVLSQDHFVFCFRAEEFAKPHLDDALKAAGIPASAASLGAILAAQDKKVLLVESVERLLEASTRDGFNDLLTLAAKDESWRLVLTCRDYSADLVRTCFLKSAEITHVTADITPLNDDELSKVSDAYPVLARPLADPMLRQLLRNPYVIDKATQIDWTDGRPLPASERDFREMFWREIICARHYPAAGMPRRREEAFTQIALRRARALTLFASCADLDQEVIQLLRRDSLIATAAASLALVAPAHDVLEDWAILHWIDEQYLLNQESVAALARALGTYPAIRRTFRKWVAELAEREPPAAETVMNAILNDQTLPLQYRDDVLVSLLRSKAATSLIQTHSSQLLADDKAVLRRIIHLMRVACVATPAWLNEAQLSGYIYYAPDGDAWPAILTLIRENLGTFSEPDNLLLLGLLEDWGHGVSWQTPYPAGANAASEIAHHLLPFYDDYGSKESRKRTLQIIAKIPNAAPKAFVALLTGTGKDDERDRDLEDLEEILFEELDGMPAARDLPDALIAAAKKYLLLDEKQLQNHRYSFSTEVEVVFGINPERSHGGNPPSAIRGPYLSLLRHHMTQGLQFYCDVFNHSAAWYARMSPRTQFIEPAWELTLSFADGTSQKQWVNARLWGLYRGMSVGPDSLQTMLMALERRLTELAESQPRVLDGVLVYLLKRSQSAAITAVVASVANAYPSLSGNALLVLLSSRDCIQLDRGRMAGESGAASMIFGLMPSFRSGSKIHEQDRIRADALPHRKRDLEMFITMLQAGPFAARVHQILDQHRAEMSSSNQPTEEDLIWRLALHRMDLRQYEVSDQVVQVPEQSSKDEGSDSVTYVALKLKQPDADVQEMVDKSAKASQATGHAIALLMWGRKVYDGDDPVKYPPEQWRERLTDAQSMNFQSGPAIGRDMGVDAPGVVAAVCTRDHWDAMSADEREWCLQRICREVTHRADDWNHLARVQRSSMSADRPCARELPALFGRTLTKEQALVVRTALAIATTHPVYEVREYAASGIGKYLWAADPAIALQSINAIAADAIRTSIAIEDERSRPRASGEFWPSSDDRYSVDTIQELTARKIRDDFWTPSAIPLDAYKTLDPNNWIASDAYCRIVAIFARQPANQASIEVFQKLSRNLVEWWDADDERQSRRQRRRVERNHETESTLTRLLTDFVLRVPAETAEKILSPILDVIDDHSKEIRWIISNLIIAEDSQHNPGCFWPVWQLFADRTKSAAWLPSIDDEYADGQEVVRYMFFGIQWTDGVEYWSSLDGNAGRVHTFFRELPVSSMILDAYLRFLYTIGSRSLPEAFITIAERLRSCKVLPPLRRNSIFMLESLLQRDVYRKPLQLKRDANLRAAVLYILDILVEQGSSAAFRMRDDFVTPISA